VEWVDPWGLASQGTSGSIRGPNISGGTVTGNSTTAGGTGASHPIIEKLYKQVPFIGKCTEADCLSEIARRIDVKSIEDLKRVTEGAESEVYRKGKCLGPCSSCAHVLNELGIKAKGL
jgi:hypothetical protein